MKVSRRTWKFIAAVSSIPFLAAPAYMFLYLPLKFGYVIQCVESAETPTEERKAFLLARNWGRIWKMQISESNKVWMNNKALDAAMSDPRRTLKIEIEWLEEKFNGAPYRARRTLIENSNLLVLVER